MDFQLVIEAEQLADKNWQHIDALVNSVVIEKGGPGSGNFNHAGRPGKVGGSAPGGGAASEHGISLTRYRTSIREALKKRSPGAALVGKFVVAIKKAHPELSDAQIQQNAEEIVDMLGVIGQERFQRYVDKFGVETSQEEIDKVLNYAEYVDREVERKTWRIQADLAKSSMVTSSSEFERIAYAGNVGSDRYEVRNLLMEEFGTHVDFLTQYVSDADMHKELSLLLNIARANPIIAAVLRKTKVIRYMDQRGTKAAEWLHDGSIIVYRGPDQTFPMMASTWVHELGHGFAQYFLPDSKLMSSFGGRRHASLYGWGNADEDFAETFTAFIADYDAYKDWIPDKFAVIAEYAQGVE